MSINITSNKAVAVQEGSAQFISIGTLGTADDGDNTASLVIEVTGVPSAIGLINDSHDPLIVGDRLSFVDFNNLTFYLGNVDEDTTENFSFRVTNDGEVTNGTVALTVEAA